MLTFIGFLLLFIGQIIIHDNQVILDKKLTKILNYLEKKENEN